MASIRKGQRIRYKAHQWRPDTRPNPLAHRDRFTGERIPTGEVPYLKSGKEDYFTRHPRRCAACKLTNDVQVWHVSYANLGHETDDDLMQLCQPCYDKVRKLHDDKPLMRLDMAFLTIIEQTHTDNL